MKEILELLEIFLRPILITKPVVDCVYGLLLGQSIHGYLNSIQVISYDAFVQDQSHM